MRVRRIIVWHLLLIICGKFLHFLHSTLYPKLLEPTCAVLEKKLNDEFQEGLTLVISGLIKLKGKNKKRTVKSTCIQGRWKL